MSCPLNLSPTVEYHTSPQQKLKSRQAAYSKKFGSPKIEQLLRQKCRIRAKEARTASFAVGRKLLHDKTYIEKFLLEELAKLDFELEDIVFQEIVEEANKWIAEAYEEEENYVIESANHETVFCPICQISGLESHEGLFSCNCGVRFTFPGTLLEFHLRIKMIVAEHEKGCCSTLSFFVEPNANLNSLHVTTLCDQCEFFYTFC